jgi:hypothetical protein
MWIINLLLCYTLWKVADMYFMVEQRFTAWFCVAISAANGAAVMTHLF